MRTFASVLGRFLTVVGLSVAAAGAQPFSAGVKVGLPLTDFVNTVSGQSNSVTNRYLVGPTAELHLPFGLGIEIDALYRHFNYQDIIGSSLGALTNVNSAGAWEFPLLLKYHFRGELVHPYVDAGVAWDTISGLTTTVANSVSNLTVANPSGEHNSFTTGFVMGAGLDVHLLVHIMPELRYTRWTSEHFNINNVLNSNQNQAEFMVGITF